MREALRRAVVAWAGFLLARPIAVLLVAAAVAAALVAAAATIRVDGGPEAFLPERDRRLAAYARAYREFGLAEMVHVDVESADAGTLEEAAAGLEARMRASGLFAEVLGPPGQAELIATGAALRGLAPLLLDDEGYRALAARLDPDDLADRMERHMERLLSPAGGAYEAVFREDPLEISALALERALAAARGAGPGGAAGGRPVSEDGRRALVAARARAPVGDSAGAAALAAFFDDAARALPPGASLAWVGGHRFQRDNEITARADVTRVSIAGTAMVVAVVAVAYARVRLVMLGVGVVLAAGLAAAAAAAIAYRPVAGVAVAFGSALTGISVDYVLHLHVPRRPGETRRASVLRGCAETGPTVLLGGVTSAAAFLVLLLAEAPGHRVLGVVAAAGLLGALAFALGPGPVLAAAGRDDGAGAGDRPSPAQRAATALAGLVLRRPRAAAAAGLVLVAVAAPGIARLRFEGDLRRFDAKSPASLAAEERVTAAWGGIAGASAVVVRAADLDGALARCAAVEDALRPFVGRGIDGVISPSAVLPPRAVREARRAAWAAWWTGPRREEVRAALAAAAGPLGIRGDAFEPFLRSPDTPPPEPARDALDGTALAPLLRRHLREADGEVHALVLVPGGGTADGRAPWVDAVRAAAPDAEPVTGGGLAAAVVAAARSALVALALPALAVVGVLLLAYYRAVAPAAAGLAALVAGLAVTAGALGWAGVPLSVMNVVAALPVYGLGVDYAIFLVDALADAPPADAVAEVGRRSGPALAAAATTAVGVGSMLLADHPSVFTLGVALLLGVTTTFVLAWLLVPAMVGWKAERA